MFLGHPVGIHEQWTIALSLLAMKRNFFSLSLETGADLKIRATRCIVEEGVLVDGGIDQYGSDSIDLVGSRALQWGKGRKAVTSL